MPPKAVARSKSPAPRVGARSKGPAPKSPAKAAPKSPPPASVSAAETPTPVPVSAAEKPTEPVGPCTAKHAEKLVSSMRPAAMAELINSSDPVEQLPARMALEYVGDKDLSWSNAQVSLKNGDQFVKEILDMQAGEFITRGSLGRLSDLGSLDLAALEGKNEAARSLATFLDACIREASERLGMNEAAPAAPAPDEEPPSWPIIIDFKDLPKHISDAARWRKTPLIVCNGHNKEVDTFLTYRAYAQIDAKWVLGETTIRKTKSMEEMREDLRRRVVGAMKNGIPLHVAMENTAVAFKQQICAEGLFPESVFNLGVFQDLSKPEEEHLYKKIVRESDLTDWVGAFPGRLKDGFFTVVTTAFDTEAADEHLKEALPFYSSMAVIEIDAASFT
eukprot:TRINITY_DN60094_c0_g1_i1.p1 TRINITY_DN60094_c0_g1~~TRINITY_DN60094_c0_g1_i1.p1  ORF type:complete len:390 (+),score=75.30 TRINITY_DN60094_c0_g1_i1:61-1230(+)